MEQSYMNNGGYAAILWNIIAIYIHNMRMTDIQWITKQNFLCMVCVSVCMFCLPSDSFSDVGQILNHTIHMRNMIPIHDYSQYYHNITVNTAKSF